jgi:hypothetical protein
VLDRFDQGRPQNSLLEAVIITQLSKDEQKVGSFADK